MRILHINAVYGRGSTGVIVEDIHNLCIKENIESYVAYSTSNKSKEEITNSYKIGGVFGKKLHAIFCRIGGKQAYFSSFSTLKFINYIKKINPDIITLHNLHSNYINLNMLLKFIAKQNIRTVIVLHDCWFYTGGCFHYTTANCYKWMESCGNCPKKMQDTKAYLKDNSAKILNDRKKYLGAIQNLTVVGVSEWVTNEAQKSFLANKDFKTIHNGIDIDFFKETPSDFRKKNNLENEFLILGLASKWLDPINKATFDYFIENLAEDEKLVLIGCNETQKKSLPRNVICLDYITNRDYLRKVYSACDVFVNCSREDTLSSVNLEVQSVGTPIVLYNNTGSVETLGENSGFIVENGDFKKLYDFVKLVKRDGKDKYQYNCRKSVVDNFDTQKNYQRYIDLYKKILESEK